MEKKKKKKRIVNRLAPIFSVVLILVTLLSVTVSATNGAGSVENMDLVSDIPLKYVKSYNVFGFSLQSYEGLNEIMLSPFDMYLYDVYNWGDNSSPNYTQTYILQYPFIDGSGTRPFHLYGTKYDDGYGYTSGSVMEWKTNQYDPTKTGSTNRNFMNAQKIEFVYDDFVLSPIPNWKANYIDGVDYNDYEQRITCEVKTLINEYSLCPYYRVTYNGSAYLPIVNKDGNVYSYDILDLSSTVIGNNTFSNSISFDFDIGYIYKIFDKFTLPIYDSPIMVSNLSITVEPYINEDSFTLNPSTYRYCEYGMYTSSLVEESTVYTCGDFVEEYPLTRVRTEFMSDSSFFSSITTAVSSFFNTDLFGDFSIGDLMLVSVGFGVLMFIIKMFRG